MPAEVWAVSMVKDEADVVVGTLQHLADEGVDGILVADNASTDGTRDLLAGLELPCRLEVVDDPEVGYYQSEKMSRLADQAHELGAVWVVPFDADEVWYAPVDRLAEVLRSIPEPYNVAPAQLWDHYSTAIDPPEGHPFETIVWRQPSPGALPKVALRWAPGSTIFQGNHGAAIVGGNVETHGRLEIRHFPYRSAAQFVRKAKNGAAAYAATDLHPTQGAHWRQYGALLDRFGEEALEDVFREFYWRFAPVNAGMVLDPAPFRRYASS